jgi:hypothetical protein
MTSTQKAVLVLGMHRSGTSAFTRVLNLLGLDLSQDLMSAQRENRHGFWESIELQELHNQALASCDSWWGDWRSVPRQWFESDSCRLFSNRIVGILKRDFANSAMFVVKDPRICRLAPLWLQTLAHLDIEPLVIMPVRHPIEVSASLAMRNGFDPLISNLLWLRHVLDVERYTRGVVRSLVTFDGLMSNWRSTVRKIGDDLQIEWPIVPASVAASIEAFLSPGDRHHSVHDGCALPAWVATTYRELLSEVEQGRKEWSAQQWNCLYDEFDRTANLLGNITFHEERQNTTEALTAAEIAAGKEIETLKADNVALRRDIEALKAESGREIEALKAVNNVARQEIEALQADSAAAQGKIEALNAHRERLSKDNLVLLSSRSWRITAPLRTIAGLLKKPRFR